MARSCLIRSAEFPYHVTGRVNNREVFPLSLDRMWEVFSSEIWLLGPLFGARVHAFVLMPNHFHLLISTPSVDLGVVMNGFMSNVTRRTNAWTGRSGHLFGGPYYRTLICSSLYYCHAVKYVYRNPVRAGLCDSVEEYPWSTISGLVGNTRLPFQLEHATPLIGYSLPSECPGDWLPWLNRPFAREAEDLLRKAFRRKSLKVIIDRGTRTPVELFDRLA